MAKRERISSGRYRAVFIPSWFNRVWFLLTLAAAAAAYALTVHFHFGALRVVSLAIVASGFIPPLAGVRLKMVMVHVDATGLRLDGKLRLRPPLHASRTELKGKESIRIVGDGGNVTLNVADEGQVASIFEATSPTKSLVFASNRVGPQVRWITNLSFAAVVVAWVATRSTPWSTFVYPAAAVVAVALFFLWAWKASVTVRVGRDGVELTVGAVRRFFPIDTLASSSLVVEDGIARGLELVLRDGQTEKIVLRPVARDEHAKPEEPARAASKAIERAIARFCARAESE